MTEHGHGPDGDREGIADGGASAGTGDDEGGTYTLVIERRTGGTLSVGALGDLSFPAGWYAYTGSALGSGGFARLDRHERVAAGEHDVRHWHVDYLLGAEDVALDTVVRSAGFDVECAVARRIDGEAVTDFGCSDCECGSHLAFRERRDLSVASVERAHRAAREAARGTR